MNAVAKIGLVIFLLLSIVELLRAILRIRPGDSNVVSHRKDMCGTTFDSLLNKFNAYLDLVVVRCGHALFACAQRSINRRRFSSFFSTFSAFITRRSSWARSSGSPIVSGLSARKGCNLAN